MIYGAVYILAIAISGTHAVRPVPFLCVIDGNERFDGGSSSFVKPDPNDSTSRGGENGWYSFLLGNGIN